MKTLIIILVLLVICFFAFKSLYKFLFSKDKCSCCGEKNTCKNKDTKKCEPPKKDI